MESINEEITSELLQAQTQIWNQAFSYIKSMSLRCAVQLGMLDIVHNHAQPMTLSELLAALPIHPLKAQYVHRLMRILIHSGFFAVQKLVGDERSANQEGYVLTPASRLLLKDDPLGMRSYLLVALDPILTEPWNFLTTWFQSEDPTPFVVAHGNSFWECAAQNPSLINLFNEAMASDSLLVSSILMSKFNELFDGLKTLVDVGGSTGAMARAIAKALPQLDCTVFDLPQVVSNLQDCCKNLKYVGGDMFQAIPPADAILLKWTLHNWSDADCLKILKNCKKAIASSNKLEGKKVIIIDIVMGYKNCDEKSIETQLLFDLEMMALVNGRQRNEKEWAKLFFDAGFNNYKINPVLGLRCLIEVYLT